MNDLQIQNIDNQIQIVDEQIVPVQNVENTIKETLNDEMFKTYSNLKEDYKTVIKHKLEGLNNVEISKLMGISKQWVGVLMKNINVRRILGTLSEIQMNDYNERVAEKKIKNYEWALEEYMKLYKEADTVKDKKSILDSIVRECKIEKQNDSSQMTFIDKNVNVMQLPSLK